jgi:hypothetical protein
LAERSEGSHRLEWSYDLGGALKPGKEMKGWSAAEVEAVFTSRESERRAA